MTPTKQQFESLLDEYERITPGSGDIHSYNGNVHSLHNAISSWGKWVGKIESAQPGDRLQTWDDWRQVVFTDALNWLHKWRAKRV